MFGLFKKKVELDEDFYEWSVALTQWIIENFGGVEQIKGTKLALPTERFFPPTDLKNHAYAEHIAHHIMKHADMSDSKEWPYKLVAQHERAPHFIGEIAMKDVESSPLGTFSVTDDQVVQITYDPALTKNPQALIATLSHECAHFLMRSASKPPPGGWEDEEPCTDGLAVFMGFGVCIANMATHYRSNSEGWEYGRSGYLCEGEILHVLSAFLIMSENSPELAKTHLKPHLAKRLDKVYGEMKEREPFTQYR